MFPTSAEIDREVYEPQSYLFLWDGDVMYLYLIIERETAEADARNMIRDFVGQIELWTAKGDKQKMLRSWDWRSQWL